MSRWKRPLDAREVRAILKNLGFEHRSTSGSHEQWVSSGLPFRKVTLDPPKQPFSLPSWPARPESPSESSMTH